MLLEIKRLFDSQAETLPDQFRAEVEKLSDEFYEHLPHDNKHRAMIDSRQLIARKQQLCQVSINILSNLVQRELFASCSDCHLRSLGDSIVQWLACSTYYR